ncbi:MAG: hypothetical protein KKF46_06775 [Nanoarchaeota archaeon]|nr:hypothetical protein [Nanoarchaeota archaeon]MBU1322033.1 hypothetical protein [Nanoarchaeota archaeon]MBU1597225.1 hypothetical protein [Nanoarchaeota archaeon]MBU2440730.1 hypothetical protein [Nanoarchaeota archaeon]
MIKVRVKKLIALFMIYLIISLMFATAFVFATIYKAEAFGQDEVPGIIRSEDNLVIRTESVMPVSVSALFTNNSFVQMNCDTIATPISCAYTQSINNVTGKITATVKEATSGDTKTVEAYVDNRPPVISTFATSSTGKDVQTTYTIVDQASTYFPNVCSGVKKVELYLNQQLVNSTSHDVGDCNVNGVLKGTIPNFVGKVNISIVVYDYLDLSANKTGTQVFIDNVAPTIMTTATVYKIGTESEIEKVSTQSTREIKADVIVEVEDDAIAPSNSVFGDFSSFDRTSPTSQKNIAASCQRQGWNKTYTCKFSNIKLMPADASLNFVVTATDQVGNTANQSLSARFTVVNDAGEVIKIEPKGTKCSGSTCYMKGGLAEVTADISTQSTYNNSEVKINGAQTKCTPSSGKWLCAVNMSVSSATFTLSGFDDLGNSISGQSTGTYIVDGAPPQLIGEINTTPVCPTASESLVIEFNVTDAQSPEVTAWANTLSISDDNETRATCTQIEGYWNCVLTVGALKSRGISTNIQVGAEDYVGNKMSASVPVKICVNVDEVPDLIEKIKTRGTLPKIDRKTASKITLEVPIGLEIVKKSNDVEILERSIVDCSATACINGQAYLVNELTLKPMMILPLKYYASCGEDWDEEDKVEVNCTQEFKIKHGLKIYTQREIETISAKLDVYNQPLGGIDKNFKKKTTEIKKQIISLDKQIAKREKVYKVLGAICSLAESLGKVNSLLQAVKTVLYGISLAIPIVGEAIWASGQGVIGTFQSFVDSTIWPQGWVPIPPFAPCVVGPPPACGVPFPGNLPGLVIKLTCSVYTCKLYDFNTYVDIGMSYTTYFVQQHDIKQIIKAQVATAAAKEAAELVAALGRDPANIIATIEEETLTETKITEPKGEYNDLLVATKNDPVLPPPLDVGIDKNKLTNIQASIPNELVSCHDSAVAANPLISDAFKDPAISKIRPIPAITASIGPASPKTAQLENNIRNILGNGKIITNFRDYTDIMYKGILYRYNKNSLTMLKSNGLYFAPLTGNVVASNSITGEAIISPGTADKLFKPFSPVSYQMFDTEVRMQNAVDAFLGDDGSWIYNPYKSKHYDGMCAPAIMFNDRKERQLLCKRLGCLEEMAKIGGPLEACEFEYNLDMCVYVESARYKIDGAATFGKVMESVGKVFLSNLLGTGLIIGYLYFWPGCAHYHGEGGQLFDSEVYTTGWRGTACGTIGALFSLRELISFMKNPYNALKSDVPVDIPAGSPDFCVGVDYSV